MTESDRKNGFVLKKILFLLKKYYIVVLAVLIAAIAVGIAVAYLRKPTFTAKEPVKYSAQVDGGAYPTTNNTAMTAYFNTVVDFCDTGVVVDRADYYYSRFIVSGKALNDYIADVRANDDYSAKLAAGETSGTEKYIDAGSIKTEYDKEKNIYTFTVSLKDGTEEGARRKLRLLALAYDLEIRDYFIGMKTYIAELVDSEEDVVVTADISKKNIVLIAALLGAAVAVAAVYLVYALDNSVSEREDLEYITGTKVLGYIKDQEVRV